MGWYCCGSKCNALTIRYERKRVAESIFRQGIANEERARNNAVSCEETNGDGGKEEEPCEDGEEDGEGLEEAHSEASVREGRACNAMRWK